MSAPRSPAPTPTEVLRVEATRSRPGTCVSIRAVDHTPVVEDFRTASSGLAKNIRPSQTKSYIILWNFLAWEDRCFLYGGAYGVYGGMSSVCPLELGGVLSVRVRVAGCGASECEGGPDPENCNFGLTNQTARRSGAHRALLSSRRGAYRSVSSFCRRVLRPFLSGMASSAAFD